MSKKLLSFLSIIFILIGCIPDDESDTFWNSIEVSSQNKPFVFVFSNTQVTTCADHAQPQLEKVLNGEIDQIESENVNGVMMYPWVEDPQYSNIAEELKFLFDQNGNNTFKTWPAYVSNLTCYNIDSLQWRSSIINAQSEEPKVKLGIKSTPSGNTIKVYVRGIYNLGVSSHSVAVYAYKKAESAQQETSTGTENFTIKNKVYSSLTPTVGKSMGSGSSGQEFREVFTLNVDGEDISNLGVVAVVYDLYDNKPIEVLNSVKLEEL